MHHALLIAAGLAAFLIGAADGRAANPAPADAPPCTIVVPKGASYAVTLAAKEVRRYVYLRTGRLLPILETTGALPEKGDIIRMETLRTAPDALPPEGYLLKTAPRDNRRVLQIGGGSDVAVLYGAYDFAEKLGVRFYLHGDVIPDERTALVIPPLDETHKPLFELRGIQPFHDFFEGPDWWNTDDYKAYASQLAKLRMNFIGLHNYPERSGGYPGPEPTVWIGLPEDCDEQGRVTHSYPAFFANTLRPGWGNVPMKTSQYVGGAASLFDTDAFGPDVQKGHFPWPSEPAACNEIFNRTADMYRDAFGFARSLGIKICVGTETPLTIPKAVQERLKALSKDPKDKAVVQELYAGIFQRLSRAFPVDYYWLWTPEGWAWGGNKPGQFEATTQDIQAALGALKELGNPLTLATCGWVLGPAHDRAALDAVLPKASPMACINRTLGHDGVEPAFANIVGRPKWAIPWLENDPNMVGPQPWVARMRYDAVDARRFGCTGLMGLHWRTKALEMNVAALAAAAWDQSWVPDGFNTTPVKPSKGGDGALGGKTADAPAAGAPKPAPKPAPKSRTMPVADFYLDYARANFGDAVAAPLGDLLSRLDGVNLPEPSTWKLGPGVLTPDGAPWQTVRKRYAFVEELAALRPRVEGPGNRDRFDYWLHTYQAMAAMAEARCLRGQLDRAMSAKDPQAALAARIELARAWTRLLTLQTAIVRTPGELGTIANLEQQTRGRAHFVDGHDAALIKALGKPLPPEAAPGQDYTGPAQLILPTVRSLAVRGEALKLKIIALDREEAKSVTVHLRPLGQGDWRDIPAKHLGRAVYEVALPPAQEDFEYHVTAESATGVSLLWPPTAPRINQTVVVTN